MIKNPTASHFKESPYLLPSLCNDIVHPIFTLKDLKECAASLKDVICRGYHLSRRKAKELFVCLLSSANRLYNPELPLYFPIFYGKKGKTFSSEEKRQVYDTVMDACVERNINVLATSFDGECFSLITEDKEGNPLTVIQLQHQVFSEVKKLDKKQIARNIVQHSRAAVTKEKLSVYNESYLRTGKVIVETGLVLPKRPYIELRKAIAENQKAKDKRVARQTSSPNLSGKSASNASKRKGGGKDKENCDSVKAPKRKKLGGQGVAVFNPKSLAERYRSWVDSSYYKTALNVSYAKIIWPAKLNEWKKNSPVKHGINVLPDLWYCLPEFNVKRQRLEHKVWDGTHLMTNMRRVVCTRGTELLKPKAWLVASQNPDIKLKYTMVADLPDKQDIGFALTTFSEELKNA